MQNKINHFRKNRKAMELSLQTIVIFIILLITFIVVALFFVTHYGEGFLNLTNLGTNTIKGATKP